MNEGNRMKFKRFIGYLTICFSTLVAAGVGIIPSIRGIKGNSDYSSSRQYVYKVSDRVVDSANQNGTFNNDGFSSLDDDDKQDVLDGIVSTFKDRLNQAQINDYKLETDGYDTIKVTFRADEGLYDDISSYLSFSRSFMASTYSGDPAVGDTAEALLSGGSTLKDNFFKAGSASIQYKDNYPYVVIDLADAEAFKTVYNAAKGTDQGNTDSNSLSRIKKADSSSDESTATTSDQKIYVLNDRLNGYELKDILENSGNENLQASDIRNHVLFSIDATSPANVYRDYNSSDNQDDVTYTQIFFGGYDLASSGSDSSIYGSTVTDETLAYKKANIRLGKFNATSFGAYSVTLLNRNGIDPYSNSVDPFVEYLVRMGEVQNSTLLIASLIALVIVVLFTLLNYGLAGIISSIATLSVLSTTLGIFNWLGIQFNIGAIIGLATFAMVAIFTNGIFHKKVKNEIYSGKTFKKAYSDGGKKSFRYALDFSVISLIAGVVAYLIPNTLLSSFGSILVIGSLFNLIIDGILVRMASYLLYSCELVEKNPRLIAVEKTLIPNLSISDKKPYFDAYKAKASPKKVKTVAIFSLILLVASIAGLVTFQSINGNIYNSSSSQSNTQLYVETLEENPTSDIDSTIDRYVVSLENTLTEDIASDENGEDKLFSDISIKSFYYTFKYNSLEKREYYYVVDLGGIYSSDSEVYFDQGNGTRAQDTIEVAVSTLVSKVITSTDSITLKQSYDVVNDTNNYYVLIYVAISIGIISIYLLFRFGLSRTISVALLLASGLVGVVGFFSLIRGAYTSIITLGLMLLSVLIYLAFDSYFVAEKEEYNLDKRNLSTNLAERRERFEYADNVAYQSVFTSSLLTMFIVISLFFAEGVDSTLLLLVLLGTGYSIVILKYLSLPTEFTFNRFFLKVKSKVKLPTPKNKKTNKGYAKGDEGPEEAIFTGIND